MAEPKESQGSAEMPTAAMPISRKSVEKTPSPPPAAESTSVLPKGQAFEILDRGPSHTATGKQPPRKLLDFSKNKNIDRFELIRELARGGMGQVFLARDTKLGRKVAIKFLLHDDPDFVQRFLVEARATARCTHENIVTIYEVGEFQGLPYMVLEFLEGKTLSDVLESQPSAKQFAELMVPVVRALERAHEHGIVHRDLKPSNIFVTDRGQVKVLDFGVARMIDRAGVLTEQVAARIETSDVHFEAGSGSNVTFTGSGDSLVGTMPYMSPEQWGADVVDHQSDLWAVGIMFWRALTNVHPAATMAPDKLRARLLDLAIPLRSIADVDAAIPPELVALVDKCTKKKKAERYASATELLADLQAFLSPAAARNDDTCPYRGLAAFGEADAKFFFGRSNEIRTALSQLETWPLLAVIGPSGVGKSSFVHAGLVPAMRATGNLRVHVLRPGRVPLHRLASILEDSAATGQTTHDPGELIGQLRDAPGMFGAMLRKVAVKHAQRVVVVVDQLEELFTLCDSDEIRKQFLSAILAAADDPTSPVRVVLSMRADFLDRLAGHKQFLAELSRGIFFLTAPDQENLRETIERPAELAGYSFEDASIVEDMLQAATSRGALPLLSFAASRLWDARDRTKKQLTTSAYKQMGGVGGAFARHADQVAAAVPPQSQMLLRAIMNRLVTPEGTRAVIDHSELLTLAAREEVELVLDQLVRARLVNLNEGDQGATVEIVHEMLISEWPTLKRWLEDSQALRGFMHELRQAAKQWAARGKPADLVWRGATAREALGNVRRHVLDLSAIEQEFLAAVDRLVVRTRWIKIGVATTVVVALVLVMLGGAIAIVRIQAAERDAQQKAVDAENEKQRAESEKKTAEEARATADQQRLEAEHERDAVKAAEAARHAAETQVKEKQGEVNQSREELEKALVRAQQEKARAEDAAAIAQQASAEAKAAKAQVEDALAKERERVKQLEAEKKHIYDKDLH
ncbi:MAG TPA: protein kinase [Kofleriaceae bacterium]|nr:protein kinase [Kofleriaceae bacterium]